MPTEGDIFVTFPVLLDTSSARLDSVRVSGDSGRIVFDPEADKAMLTSGLVVAEAGGEIWVGAEGCPFQGNAEILLTGERFYSYTEAFTSGT